MCKFECNADTCKMFVGVRAARLIWIYYRDSRRQRLAGFWQVMIGDYYIQVDAVGKRDFFDAGCTRIDTDDKRDTVLVSLFESRNIYAIALSKPVRDVKHRFRSEHRKHLAKQHSAGRAVNIIIAPDEYLFAYGNSFLYAVDGLPHTL